MMFVVVFDSFFIFIRESVVENFANRLNSFFAFFAPLQEISVSRKGAKNAKKNQDISTSDSHL
jgi:hypothetical protein